VSKATNHRASQRALIRALAFVLLLSAACSPAVSESTTTTQTTSDPTTTTPPDTTTLPEETTTTATTLPPLETATFESLDGIRTVLDFASSYTASGLTLWERSVPGVEDITITSTSDGAEQPALWVAPRNDRPRPLLVVLHSWSTGYRQHAGIPFAMWAQENGWAVIAPHFRGVNDNANAVGSDLAVQDVVDAIDFATAQEGVDPDRVYTVGFSGGGMMSLLIAGRHPEKVTAAAAWTPVYDLIEFYRYSRSAGRSYADHIRRACGGDPTSSDAAREECLRRSPMNYLDAARDQGVPIFIGQGIADRLLPPSQPARAFNQLADPGHAFTDDEVSAIGGGGVPEHLAGVDIETYFSDGEPQPVLARQSGQVWIVFFQAAHEMVYAPALRWFASDPR
jgi:acetyl esterase/lipase